MTDTAQPAAQPTALGERIVTLDVIRGFALLGILLMNIVIMGGPPQGYFNPAYAGAPSAEDFNAWFVTHTFFEGSMRTLFSMLFGAGFLLFLDRMEARNLGLLGAKYYARRAALLIFLGIIDLMVFLWQGDILTSYGLVGFFLLLFYKAPMRRLIAWMLVLFALTAMFNIGGGAKFAQMRTAHDEAVAARDAGRTLTEEQQTAIEGYEEGVAFFNPSKEDIEDSLETARGGWGSVSGANVGKMFSMPLGMFVSFYVFDPLAAMLLGMIAFRLGLLQGRWPLWGALALTTVGFGVGIPVNLNETNQIIASDYSIHGFLASMSTYDLGRVSLALGWLGVVLLVCKLPVIKLITVPLAAVGRMALTNYLSHSILAAIVFIGLGYYGQFGRAELYYVVAAFWAFNIVFSLIWLSFFRMGPFEWIWRAGTYGSWPPIFKNRGENGAAEA